MADKDISFVQGLYELSKGKLQSFYCLAGEEDFFKDKLLEAITARIFENPGMKGFNFYRFSGNEHSLADIISASLSMPMPGSDKLIIVKDFEKLKIQDESDFEKFLKRPAPGSVTLFFLNSPEKSTLNKILSAHTKIISCQPLKDKQITGWLKDYCRNIGLSIEDDAAQLLAEQAGNHLLILEQEINKVISNKKDDDKRIRLDDVALTLGILKEFTFFNLQDTLGQKNLGKSLLILNKMLESGQNVDALLGSLFSFIKRLHAAKVVSQNGQDYKQVAGALKMNEYAVQKLFPHLRHYKFEEIIKIYHYLHEADIELKTSSGSTVWVMHKLFHRICKS